MIIFWFLTLHPLSRAKPLAHGTGFRFSSVIQNYFYV